MAKIVENTKGFKVIELSRVELTKINGLGICDMCNETENTGYYVAVLNHWLCKKCYLDFTKRVTRHKEDIKIELVNYQAICKVYELENEEKE